MEVGATQTQVFLTDDPRSVHRLGVGAPIPAGFDPKSNGGTDALRRKLIGRRPTKEMPDKQQQQQQQKRGATEDDSDDDVGRSALGATKRKKLNNELREMKGMARKQVIVGGAHEPEPMGKLPPQAQQQGGPPDISAQPQDPGIAAVSLSKKKKKNKKKHAQKK